MDQDDNGGGGTGPSTARYERYKKLLAIIWTVGIEEEEEGKQFNAAAELLSSFFFFFSLPIHIVRSRLLAVEAAAVYRT